MAETTPTGAPPTCRRHPERVVFTTCQRCGRPTCYECQSPAPVGIQCVDCVQAGRREMRPVRTTLGQRHYDNPVLVTTALIVVCGIAWAAQLLTPAAGPDVTDYGAFAPFLGESEPWRFVTGAFLHSDAFPLGAVHIGLNMYVLWILGRVLEPALGRWVFLASYLVLGFAGHVAFLLLSGGPRDIGYYTGAVGASGAIFGFFGMMIPLARRLMTDLQSMLVVVGINLAIGFTFPNIAWQAHIGGLVAGLVVGFLIDRTASARRPGMPWLILAGTAVVLGAATVAYYNLVTPLPIGI